MDVPGFLAVALRDLHSGLRAEIEPMDQAQLDTPPAPSANTMSFLLWHFVRTEDETLHRAAQAGPSIWSSGGWADRLGIPTDANGTGFTNEQMLALRPAKADLVAYCEEVWAAVPTLTTKLTDTILESAPNPERPTMTVGRNVGNVVLGHGFWHLGDIRYTKGLMGMPFSR